MLMLMLMLMMRLKMTADARNTISLVFLPSMDVPNMLAFGLRGKPE